MEIITLEGMKAELAVLHPTMYTLKGKPRAGATPEGLARCKELEQMIADEEANMNGGGDEETPPTAIEGNRSDAEKIADLTEQLRREKLITKAYKDPKGVAITNRFRPDGETIRIDEAMLPSLAEAERLPVSIPEALKEGLIDKAKALVLNKAVERRIRCYVKKAGFHENDRTHNITQWDGGYKKGLSESNLEKAKAWLLKIGRVKPDPNDEEKTIPNPVWDTSIVIPNMDNI